MKRLLINLMLIAIIIFSSSCDTNHAVGKKRNASEKTKSSMFEKKLDDKANHRDSNDADKKPNYKYIQNTDELIEELFKDRKFINTTLIGLTESADIGLSPLCMCVSKKMKRKLLNADKSIIPKILEQMHKRPYISQTFAYYVNTMMLKHKAYEYLDKIENLLKTNDYYLKLSALIALKGFVRKRSVVLMADVYPKSGKEFQIKSLSLISDYFQNTLDTTISEILVKLFPVSSEVNQERIIYQLLKIRDATAAAFLEKLRQSPRYKYIVERQERTIKDENK